jgi:Na+/H+-translocating membrane pyrophosphatase
LSALSPSESARRRSVVKSDRPPAPRLGGAIRAAGGDFYHHSLRLVAANLVWGLMFSVVLLGGLAWPPILLLSPLLTLPTIGIFRLAALIQRDEFVALSDAFIAWRRLGRRALAMGTGLLLCMLVFGTNIYLGLSRGDYPGLALATMALWGFVVTVVCSCVLWPLAADPRRETLPVAEIVRLGFLLVIAFPVRFARLALVVAVIMIISVPEYAGLVSVSVAFVALLAARYVLPAADRFAPPPPIADPETQPAEDGDGHLTSAIGAARPR